MTSSDSEAEDPTAVTSSLMRATTTDSAAAGTGNEEGVEPTKTAFVLESEEYDSARDVLYSRVGEYGKWQRNVFLWASLVGIPAAWHILAITFFSPSVDHWCAKPEEMPFANWTDQEWKFYAIPKSEEGQHEKCNMFDLQYLPDPFLLNTSMLDLNFTSRLAESGKELKIVRCRKWDFDHSVFSYTIDEQWELVCNRSHLSEVIQATYMVGVLVGCVVYGHLSDRIGRRSVILLGTVQLIIASLCTTLTESLALFVLLRFLVAMGTNAQFTVAFVLVMELIGGRKRTILGVSYEYPFSFGFISLAGLAYWITDWRYLQLSISLPIVFLLVYYWVLPESPRWLIAHDRLAEAQKIIDDIAATNGRSLPEALRHVGPDGATTVCVCGLATSPSSGLHLSPEEEEALLETKLERKKKKELRYTLVDLFRGPNMRKKTLNIHFNWFVNSFVYYGLSLNSGNLGGSVFINILLGGLVEIPAYALSTYVLVKQGRRWPLCISMVVGGVACLLTMAFPPGTYPHEWPIITFAMIGKFGISASFAIIYVYSAELYPTVVRNIGVSSSSMCARIGSILAPFLKLLGDVTFAGLPIIIFGATSLAAGLLALLLPETNNRKLPETLEDGEKFGLRTSEEVANKPAEKGDPDNEQTSKRNGSSGSRRNSSDRGSDKGTMQTSRL